MTTCDFCHRLRYCDPVLKVLEVAGDIEVVEVVICIDCRFKETWEVG